MGKYVIKPTDGTTISDYICIFEERWGILNICIFRVKLRKKGEKWNEIDGI